MPRPFGLAVYRLGSAAQGAATFVSACCLSAIAAVVCVDVALRYIFNSPFEWSLEFIEWFALFLFIFSLPKTTFSDGHVRMDLVLNAMPPAGRRFVRVLYGVTAVLILGTLLWAEWGELRFSWELWTVTEILRLPTWPKHLAVIVVSLILFPFFLALVAAGLAGRGPGERRDTLDALRSD